MSTVMKFCAECERHFMTNTDRVTCHWCTHSLKQRTHLAAIREGLRNFEFTKGAVSVVNRSATADVELRKPAMTGLPPRSTEFSRHTANEKRGPRSTPSANHKPRRLAGDEMRAAGDAQPIHPRRLR